MKEKVGSRDYCRHNWTWQVILISNLDHKIAPEWNVLVVDRKNSMDPFDAPTADPQKTVPVAGAMLIPESLYGQFGKYQIIEKIGQGGMGAVYRAKDSVLERQVAIKVPLLDSSDRAATLGRFSREAVAAAVLRHPSICPVFEFSQFEGIPFIVSPFLKGRSLQNMLDEDGPWSTDQALKLGILLANALQYAHQHSVVHRDIKPQNILIEEGGTPIILDFGLAKMEQANQMQWTQSGEVLGTPAYMPPEQIDGSVGAIGPASDIYALGMTLYCMLTGRTAFSGAAQFMIPQILMDPPRPPSSFALSKKEIEPLDELILKALQKKPIHRFKSMSEFAFGMQQVLNGLGRSNTSISPLPDLRILGTGHRYHPTQYQQSIRIGRQRSQSNNPNAMANDLVIRADGSQDRTLRISRQHLEIVASQHGIGVIDRSQAGISINGKSANKGEVVPLAIGDIVSVAGVIEIEILSSVASNCVRAQTSDPMVGFEATMGDFYKDGSN